VYPVGVVLRVSLTLCAVFWALSLVGSIAIHCIPLPAGTVFVGHCGPFVVTLSLLCAPYSTTGVFREDGVTCCMLF